MRVIIILLAAAVVSCTGSLSESQKKRIKESMEQGEIKKLTESQIIDAAFTYGRSMAIIVEQKDKLLSDSMLLDSIAKANQVEIISLQANNPQLRKVERQVLEAYLEGAGASENVQKMGTDTLIFTKPIFREHPDGSTEFLKAICIRMTRKQVVLSIKD
ncbi:MAG: hypothetical protein MUF39_03235 [Cyclobacteriaceae bacterium]|jgi:hypothetical protein|nr:hypothetical protein [Cyclobacteriaceae bacterium]